MSDFRFQGFLAAAAAATLMLAACSPGQEQTGADLKANAGTPACPLISAGAWQAWIDAQPPDPERLIIRAEIVLPTPGYKIAWRVGAADKRRPPIQHMHLDLTPPTGMVAQVLVTEMIEYAAPAAFADYSAIVVHCGDAPEALAEISPVSRLP